MKKSDFYYDLPAELIAQEPSAARDHSRLLVIGRHSGKLAHKHFYDIVDYLHPGDCLVLNNSKVLPARLFGVKEDTGAKVEFLLLEDHKKRRDDRLFLCGFLFHEIFEREGRRYIYC